MVLSTVLYRHIIPVPVTGTIGSHSHWIASDAGVPRSHRSLVENNNKMDFASQLANLERTAKAAAAATTVRNAEGDRRRRNRSPNAAACADHQGRKQQRLATRPNSNNYQDQPQQQRSPLEALKRFGYRVDPPAWTPKTERSFPHICLLAITIDDLPYEHIWKAWAAAAASENCYVSLVCHAKFPRSVQSEWLKERLLLQPPRIGRGTKFDDPVFHTRCPEWGSVEITRAMKDCLQDAVMVGAPDQIGADDPRFAAARFVIARPGKQGEASGVVAVPTIDKFIFISETCLPVTTLKEGIQALFLPGCAEMVKADDKEATSDLKVSAAMEDVGVDGIPQGATTSDVDTSSTVDPWDVSWVNARNRNTPGTPKNKYERDQFSDIHRMIPGMHRWKADQWLVLSRRHALAVLYIDGHMSSQPADQLWNAFAKINASDEMYFPTALGVLRILNEGETDDEKKYDGISSSKVLDCYTEKKPSSKLSSHVPSSHIVKRAVTYTDWSVGMRNPASFSGGHREFAKVAGLARQQGSLFARKFSLQGPGESTLVTGQISVDEWNNAISTLTAQGEK